MWFRTAAVRGEWSPWQPAQPEAEDGPDLRTAEARARPRWKLGNPYWTGPANWIQYRAAGPVGRLRAHFVWSESGVAGKTAPSALRADAPAIIRRAQWGANESIVRAPPSYADRVRFAVVHHTAGTNNYAASQSAAIVRGIQTYHVLGNGWNDIGYNFLVDKYGQVFEGRGGGIDRNVIGAHAQGFNTGSTGVAVLGTYTTTAVPSAGTAALVRLLAWRLDVAHVDPLAVVSTVSFGSDRFPAGTTVRLRAISGHRDTGYTACPGAALYGRLGTIAKSVAARGLPKLYDPAVTGALGGLVRFRGRLSTALPWTVTIRDGVGSEVARGSGAGTAVDWTWNASTVASGSYTYAIAAGPDVLPATGTVPGPPALAVTRLAAAPAVVTPNGDGVGETTRIEFSLTAPATVTLALLDSGGALEQTLVSGRSYRAGAGSVVWDGGGVADGRYHLRLTARSFGQEAARSADVIVDRNLGHFTVEPVAFSPNGDGRLDTVALSFDLLRTADVRVPIKRGASMVASVASGSFAPGHHALAWNGRNAAGQVPDGAYSAVVAAATSLGERRLRRLVVVDTRSPVVRIVSATRTSGLVRLRLWLSEPAVLDIWYDGRLTHAERSAGYVSVYRRIAAEVVRVRGVDSAANVGRSVSAAVR